MMKTAPAAALPFPAPLRLGASAGVCSPQKGLLPLPAEIVICPWGASKDLTGADVIVNDVTVAELAANQSKYGFDEIALDFNHATVPGTDKDGQPVKPREPLPIAAMGSLTVVPHKGIIFRPLSWTPEGETYYSGRHYRDLSPTVGRNEKGEVTFVHSVALTRNGQIHNLHAYSATAGLPALTTLSTPLPTHTTTMDNNTPDYRALLLSVLKLDDAATDEQIIAAASTPLSAPEKKEEEVPAATAMAASTTPENLVAFNARLDSLERDNLVSEATRAGKLIPLSADALKLTPLSVLKDLITQLPAGAVNMTPGTPAKETPSLKALSADEEIVRQRMGFTLEQWHAANPSA